MNTYWLSFRLEHNASYTRRYEALMATINEMSSTWWVEPSSFLVFSSGETIDTIAAKVKSVVDPKTDLVTIGMTDYKSARLVGKSDDPDIFALIPFMKKV